MVLESDGYSGGVTTSGSGYDGIYAPISSPGTGYGRYNPQRNGSHHLGVGPIMNNGHHKSGSSNNNNNNSSSKSNIFSHHRSKQQVNGSNLQRQSHEERDEENSPFEPHTQRYATEWD